MYTFFWGWHICQHLANDFNPQNQEILIKYLKECDTINHQQWRRGGGVHHLTQLSGTQVYQLMQLLHCRNIADITPACLDTSLVVFCFLAYSACSFFMSLFDPFLKSHLPSYLPLPPSSSPSPYLINSICSGPFYGYSVWWLCVCWIMRRSAWLRGGRWKHSVECLGFGHSPNWATY